MRMRAAHGDKPSAQGGQTLSFPFGPDVFDTFDSVFGLKAVRKCRVGFDQMMRAMGTKAAIDLVPNYLCRHKTMYREICAVQENGGAAWYRSLMPILELLRKPLYHGSVWSFKRVDVSKGRPYKDFGKGF